MERYGSLYIMQDFMERYEFLSLCRHYNGLTGTTEWFIGIHSSRLSQGLFKMPFVHEENGRLIINNEAEALMALLPWDLN